MDNYKYYKDLENRMLEARAMSDETLEDSILDEMDDVWYRMDSDEHTLLKQDAIERRKQIMP